MSKKSQSPLPSSNRKADIQINFFDALRAVSEGKKIRRHEWQDKKEYGAMNNNLLCVYRIKTGETSYKFHTWIVSEGDMIALDWQVVNDAN